MPGSVAGELSGARELCWGAGAVRGKDFVELLICAADRGELGRDGDELTMTMSELGRGEFSGPQAGLT